MTKTGLDQKESDCEMVRMGINDPIVLKARRRSEAAHACQVRDDGRPYATHPHEVVQILVDRGHMKPEVLAAAYLHDVLEDTSTPRDDLVAEFGEEIVGIVDEVTNIGPADRSFEDKQAALLEHAGRMTPRAKLVKLADRLHNLGEMNEWPRWKQDRYALATLQLLVAIQPVPDPGLEEKVRRLALRLLALDE
ncbi:MAG: bifunctional (p)ppGpp synthetase/guanosine-3',5'-bis(diphosphate) 3'-pyrophosphohydrolase [Phycisphaerales bacterium]|nr:bifunctional (p)ppGpp synthetase/guanosine-3',5'-bis(diphosphate) 3'-pyrophosphohydrolase [Phycisphaerales bacterium]MCB9855320.1 bifunctional (p)ppGpp synthetase/guanosine-3',5'-bis(diphosphate) 3'-pyrophosphohydrolase [Phycisphaerales bacterium]MCB9862913.1 bifunctional (p)ppGpp synthetase/guanosine-3',5'-bis(diphosphate) 3'-pyrophosphohydrolase [Phycisphaerales bacterium]